MMLRWEQAGGDSWEIKHFILNILIFRWLWDTQVLEGSLDGKPYVVGTVPCWGQDIWLTRKKKKAQGTSIPSLKAGETIREMVCVKRVTASFPGGGEERKALSLRGCQFPWCIYSRHAHRPAKFLKMSKLILACWHKLVLVQLWIEDPVLRY